MKSQPLYPKALQVNLKRLGHSDYEIRMRAVENIGSLVKGQSTPPELIKLYDDAEELVRIAVAESLGRIGDKAVLPVLWKKIDDSSPLVRRYTAIAIGLLGGDKDARKLEEKLKSEKSNVSKLGFYYALYYLGYDIYLLNIVRLLNSKDYRMRCASANLLADCLDDRPIAQLILSVLQAALKEEATLAAKSSITLSIREAHCQVKKVRNLQKSTIRKKT